MPDDALNDLVEQSGILEYVDAARITGALVDFDQGSSVTNPSLSIWFLYIDRDGVEKSWGWLGYSEAITSALTKLLCDLFKDKNEPHPNH